MIPSDSLQRCTYSKRIRFILMVKRSLFEAYPPFHFRQCNEFLLEEYASDKLTQKYILWSGLNQSWGGENQFSPSAQASSVLHIKVVLSMCLWKSIYKGIAPLHLKSAGRGNSRLRHLWMLHEASTYGTVTTHFRRIGDAAKA